MLKARRIFAQQLIIILVRLAGVSAQVQWPPAAWPGCSARGAAGGNAAVLGGSGGLSASPLPTHLGVTWVGISVNLTAQNQRCHYR